MIEKAAIAEIIAHNLKRLRSEKKLSMQSLANIADIEKSQIVRIEKGHVDARVSSIYILSNALDVDIAEFFKEKIS